MSDYKKTLVHKNPLSERAAQTPENKYWSKFTYKHTERFPGRVSQISFSEKAPLSMLVCAATRVHIYDVNTMTTKKTVTRFNTPVNCADIRDDGEALIAGSDEGLVQLFDLSSRAILRSYSHKSSVRVAKFFEDGTRVFSGGDDKTLKLFDLPSETELLSFTAHDDHIRAALQSSIAPDVIITGSYDHTVKLFDIRDKTSPQNTLTLDHGAPVSSMCMLNTGYLVTAGENFVRIWDIVSGGKLLSTLSYHQKAITCVDINPKSSRIISGGLDGFIKFYDMTTFQCTHSIQCPNPILSVGMAPDCSTISAGFVDGGLTTLQRPPNSKNHVLPHRLRSSAYAHFHRGAAYKGEHGNDFILEKERKAKIQPYDVYLKSFQYGAALDTAINTRDPNVVIAIIDELQQRSGLKRALQNRTDVMLEPILKFSIKHMTNPVYSPYLTELLNCLLDIYTPVIGQSQVLDHHLFVLKQKISEEVYLHDDYTMVQGELDLLLASVPSSIVADNNTNIFDEDDSEDEDDEDDDDDDDMHE